MPCSWTWWWTLQIKGREAEGVEDSRRTAGHCRHSLCLPECSSAQALEEFVFCFNKRGYSYPVSSMGPASEAASPTKRSEQPCSTTQPGTWRASSPELYDACNSDHPAPWLWPWAYHADFQLSFGFPYRLLQRRKCTDQLTAIALSSLNCSVSWRNQISGLPKARSRPQTARPPRWVMETPVYKIPFQL